jgi:NhaP-type Na+/H+ or K+/H+ antiporter
VDWALAAIAGTALAYAAVSRRFVGTAVTPAIVFVAAGLLFGPSALGLVGASAGSEEVRRLAEVTLALVLFSDAARIDLRRLRVEYAVPVRLLGVGLPLTIALGAVLAAAVFGALGWAEALVLSVVLAPTDAALGQAVVTEPRLPSRIRQGLNVESGLNDGICVPILLIAIALAEEQSGVFGGGHAVRLVAEQIGYGALAGGGAGAVCALILLRGAIERSWRRIVPVAGAALAYGIAVPIGGSGFIAAFVAGMVFGAIVREGGGEAVYLVEELGGLFSAVTFLVFGAVLLEPTLSHLSWSLAGYAALSLTVARMVPVALAMIGTGARPRTVAFVGWFGPRGLASIVFAVIVLDESNLPHVSTIVAAAYLAVGLSVLAHGVTAAPLARRYARWYESHETPPAMESEPALEHRWRRSFPSATAKH